MQVVWSSRRGSRRIEHLGSAHDEAGVAAQGHREVLGFEVGDSEDGAFLTGVLRSLKFPRPAGVPLATSQSNPSRSRHL
uniref:transposase n=1 Tax=Mycobacterium avium TaxID=1764 RepID=UPI0022AB8E41|nr:transposase [Mycobacterium avium]